MSEQCDNLDLRLQSCLGFISRKPRHAELRRKVEARASKATDDVFQLNDMTIDNRPKALIRILLLRSILPNVSAYD